MMRIMTKDRQIIVAVALYAVTMVLFAFISGAHHHGASGHAARVAAAQTSGVASLCVGLGQHGDESAADACCDACLSISASGLPPLEIGFSRLEIERKARIYFAQRFGHVADGAPDDLRSRAPPRFS